MSAREAHPTTAALPGVTAASVRVGTEAAADVLPPGAPVSRSLHHDPPVCDEECFAAGAVPGDLIVEACVIDREGRPGRRITR